jgi:hypothetical protein
VSDNKIVALILGGAVLCGAAMAPAIFIQKPSPHLPPDGLQAQPQLGKPDSTYGAPYNVRIHCAVRGGPGLLDPKKGPRPGQVYVMTCKSYAWR